MDSLAYDYQTIELYNINYVINYVISKHGQEKRKRQPNTKFN